MRQGLRAARSTWRSADPSSAPTAPSAPRSPRAALGGALALAVAVGALGTLAACTGGGSGGSGNDAKSSQYGDDATVSPAPPGKYKTLPQPCIAVDLDTLKAVVPGAQDYAGTESLTYDTDRRVGCTWQAKAPDGSTRKLVIDMERVVSYDPQVSDEVAAGFEYDKAASVAAIPALPPPGSTPTTGAPASVDPAGSTGSSGTSGSNASSGSNDSTDSLPEGTASPTGSPGDGTGTEAGNDLSPRRLTNVGNAAFIYDAPSSGKAKPRDDVTLVFRTANVVVTIHYGETSHSDVPLKRADLQEDTTKVAQQLERKVEG